MGQTSTPREQLLLSNIQKAGSASGTFADYITACIYSVTSAAAGAGVKDGELTHNEAASEKLRGYKELDATRLTSPNRDAIISALEGVLLLEDGVFKQAEALGKPITDYKRPELPAHLKLVLEQVNYVDRPILSNKEAANDKAYTKVNGKPSRLKSIDTGVQPDDITVETPNHDKGVDLR